ncbi:MAG: hypothetical protein ACRDVN_14760 [Jiangellaceae bacterium]
MSSTQILVIVLIALVVIVLAGVAWYLVRRQQLQRRFGPEYDRAVAEGDSRLAAERELRERERRHSELELSELSPDARERYTAQWEKIQVRFVDAPENAVGAADELVTQLIADRGYPTDDYAEQLDHLSVEHARTLSNYRDAHEISLRNREGQATTEQLRQAVLHYRSLVADLLGDEHAGLEADTTRAPTRDDSTPDATLEADRGPADDSTHDSTQR